MGDTTKRRKQPDTHPWKNAKPQVSRRSMAFRLREKGLSLKEIAESMKVSQHTVETWLYSRKFYRRER
jgi:DNA-binding NarL/FixJ family response regulator